MVEHVNRKPETIDPQPHRPRWTKVLPRSSNNTQDCRPVRSHITHNHIRPPKLAASGPWNKVGKGSEQNRAVASGTRLALRVEYEAKGEKTKSPQGPPRCNKNRKHQHKLVSKACSKTMGGGGVPRRGVQSAAPRMGVQGVLDFTNGIAEVAESQHAHQQDAEDG